MIGSKNYLSKRPSKQVECQYWGLTPFGLTPFITHSRSFLAAAISILFVAVNAFAQVSDNQPAPFEKIKDFLSTPPVVQDLRFRKVVVGKEADGKWTTNLTIFNGGYSNNSFFLEEFTSDLPGTEPFKVAGRDNDLYWHFQHGELRKWRMNTNESENILLVLVGVAQNELLTAVNLGIPMLANSTVRWAGQGFHAEQDESLFRRDVPPKKARVAVSGEFTVSTNGKIITLSLKRADIERPFKFTFEWGEQNDHASVPDFFPRVVRQEFHDSSGKFQGFIEREFLTFRLRAFGHTSVYGSQLISSPVRASFVYTSNALFKETKAGFKKVENAKGVTQHSTIRTYVVIALVSASLIYPIVWWRWQRPPTSR